VWAPPGAPRRGLLGELPGQQGVDGRAQLGEAVLELVEFAGRAVVVTVTVGVLVAARTDDSAFFQQPGSPGCPQHSESVTSFLALLVRVFRTFFSNDPS